MRQILRLRSVRNVAYNLGGQLLPMVVALVAIPVLVRDVGAARLGFLGLAWALIGYFALLDLGLSRVVTRRIARADADGRLPGETRLLWRVCIGLFLVVAAIAAAMALFVPTRLIVGDSASPALVEEARVALLILWATLPATVVIGLLRGSLEGLQQFGKANALRAVFGAWSFAAPLVVLSWSVELGPMTLSIAIGRAFSLIAHGYLSVEAFRIHARNAPASAAVPREEEPRIGHMLREGGWLTVSNVVGPMMVTFDRFAIAGIVSLTAASYYFVPQEVSLRLLVIPGAIATTIFPLLARIEGARAEHQRISRWALAFIAATCLPACALIAGFAHPLLSIWMGPTFAHSSAPVAAILAIGLYGNCCAQAPFAWIQAAGRSDVTGKLHLIQLPFYAVLLIALTFRFGIVGAAIAWSLRALADALLLFRASSLLFPGIALDQVLPPIAFGVLLIALLAAGPLLESDLPRSVGSIALFCASIGLAIAMLLRLKRDIGRLG